MATPGNVTIRRAAPHEGLVVEKVLRDAANWLRDRGMPLWEEDEMSIEAIDKDVQIGQYFLAEVDGAVAGTLRYQLEDPTIWPEVTPGDSAFVHRLAVRRAFAGKGVSRSMLRWAADRTRSMGRTCLRLDCEADRPKLREFYLAAGFRHHSDGLFDGFTLARFEMDVSSPTDVNTPPSISRS